MTITNPDDVKILVKQDIDPTDLTNACLLADKQLVAITGRDLTEWNSSYHIFGALQAVGATFAAWVILSGWDKEEYLAKAQMMWTAYETLLQEFRKLPMPEDLTDPDIDIVENVYTIHQLNPDVPNFISQY